jgi:hypothetical protein
MVDYRSGSTDAQRRRRQKVATAADGTDAPTTWELRVTRLGIQRSAVCTRTYGSYQAFLKDKPIDELSGNVCECPGPGENDKPGSKKNRKRIKAGRYPLWTVYRPHFHTMNYYLKLDPPGQHPMPGILLDEKATYVRDGIIIHPGHPDTLYISSIGCLNLTKPLQATEKMDFQDSRSRVIAIIDNLRSFAPQAFEPNHEQRIPDASIVIADGPDNVLPGSVDPDAVA